MKIKTKELKNALSKLNKLIGSNSIMEICNYVELMVNEKRLIMTVTDKTYTITARIDIEDDQEITKIVSGKKLVKLIKSTTADEVVFNFKDSYLEIKGNGRYKLEYYTEGFPSYEIEPEQVLDVDTEEFKTILHKHKGTPSDNLDTPVLTGYYIGDEVLSLDGTKMALTRDKLLNKELLIPADLVKLVDLFDTENMKIMVDDNKLLFDSDNLTIFGSQLYGISDFPDLTVYKEIEYNSYCDVDTNKLANVLSRVEIFANPMDSNGARLEFDGKTLIISDVENKSEEELEVEGKGSFDCKVVIDDLILFNKNATSDKVRILCDDEARALCLRDDITDYFTGKLAEA